MTGYTPIYNLPYPQPSDLVSAYPGTGQDLAEEVETVLAAKADLSGATYTGTHNFTGATVTGTGLTFIATASATAAASVTINNCFSSVYQNYRITFIGTQSTGANMEARLRVSGSDANTNYSRQYFFADNATTTLGRVTSQNSFVIASVNTTVCGFTVDLYGPAVAAQTAMSSFCSRGDTVLELETGVHSTATAYDGITIFGGGGATITGTFRVYGYRNS